MRAFAILSCLIASTLAYNVTSPGEDQDWNNDGDQTLSWTRVDTDPSKFTAVLFQRTSQKSVILAQDIDGKSGSVKIPAPSGGWPTGDNFSIRIVRDADSLAGILAESKEFDIDDIPVASRTATSASQTPTSPSASGSDPTKSPGAASPLAVQTGLVALMSMLGFALV